MSRNCSSISQRRRYRSGLMRTPKGGKHGKRRLNHSCCAKSVTRAVRGMNRMPLTNELRETTNDGLAIRRLLKFVGQLRSHIHHQALAVTQVKKRATDRTDNTDEIQVLKTSQCSQFFNSCYPCSLWPFYFLDSDFNCQITAMNGSPFNLLRATRPSPFAVPNRQAGAQHFHFPPSQGFHQVRRTPSPRRFRTPR